MQPHLNGPVTSDTLERAPTLNARADQDLLRAIHHGELAALGALYDRYGPLVFQLVRSAAPEHADLLTIDVFLELWTLPPAAILPGPVLVTLLHLTSIGAARYRAKELQELCTAVQSLPVPSWRP